MKQLKLKFYVKLACVVCLCAIWKMTASLIFCYLFWITTLVWVVRYIIQAKPTAGLVMLLGITCNALVTLWNAGVMPAVGVSPDFRPALPVWNVSGKGQWLALSDHAAFQNCSIGDLCLIAGLLLLVRWKLTSPSYQSNSAAEHYRRRS
jgi:hypothetical protein